MAKRGMTGVIMRSAKVRDHEATVISTEAITPHFVRVHLQSDTLFDEADLAPTAWLRGWFPDEHGREFQRGYTFSSGNVETGEFSLDFVLHEPAGPASGWAKRCEPGDRLSVSTMGSSAFEVPEDPPAGYLLIGDPAALPGLASLVAALPPTIPVELYLEEQHSQDRDLPLPDHPLMRIHWVPRTGPDALAAALEPRDWSNWYVWVTPESGSLKHLRVRLRDEFGFPKSETHAQAYWAEGRAMGKEREKEKERMLAAEPAASDAAPAAPTAAAPAAPTAPAPRTPAPPPAKGEWAAAAGKRLLAPLRSTFILTGVLQALVTLIELAPFVLLVELSRRLLTGAPAETLWALGIWAVALLIAGMLLGTGLMLWLHRVDARFARDLRTRLLDKLTRLPLGWFGARGSAQVKRIVQDDTIALHALVTHAVGDAVAAVVAPVAVLAYLFVVDWRMALLLFIPVICYIVSMYIMLLRSYDVMPRATKWEDRMNTEAAAYLDGQPVVRTFGGAATSTFRARLEEYVAFLGDWQRPFSGFKTFMDLTTRPTTFLLIICLFGTWWVTAGWMDPIALLPFVLLGTSFGGRLLGIGYGLGGLRDGMQAAQRVQRVLEEPELRAPRESTPGASAGFPAGAPGSSGDAPPGRVEFDGVDFAYRPGIPVLRDVSIDLVPGTVTALVGPSGSGKSTLAALLARFHDVTGGAIRIDGQDVRDLAFDDLYAAVGFVFQDTQLVQGTVRENIALARPDATAAEIEAAAVAANIHDRIMRLPHGYDTLLGPDAALSGGERQRLTIARALLADTPVLVLDEATAFADPESEFLVQQALGRLTADRTVLVIAHRLHTITGADRIIVLDHGSVAESGTHEELLARNGRYRQLWDAAQPLPLGMEADR